MIFDSTIKLQVKGLSSGVMQIIFGNGEAQGDSYTSIEKFVGSRDSDTLTTAGKNDVSLGGGDGGDTIQGGGGDDTLSGDGGSDTIDGKKGNDVIDGGSGKDTLTGSAGKDSFVFSAPVVSANADTITDFIVKDDTIRLDDQVFKQLGASGKLAKAEFFAGAAAHDADDRILYDKKTGALSYDADGKGGAAAVEIAILDAHLKLTNGDFLVV